MKRPPRERLRRRAQAWATRLRVRPVQIRVQDMTRKWGSCSPGGRITLAMDLARQPAAFQEFVIVHELLHLRFRNHGRLFEAVLRTYLAGNRFVQRDFRPGTRFEPGRPPRSAKLRHPRAFPGVFG